MSQPFLQATESWRRAFKYGNRFMLLMWRLGLGPMMNLLPEAAGQIMVVTHTGRKSGRTHRQPLNYALIDGDVYCVAGFGPSSDWYKNLRKHPAVQVWLPDGWWDGRAEDVGSEPRRLERVRAVIRGSGLAGRLGGIDVRTISDARLDELTRDYCLIRIHRTAARTGTDGPGDLAWVWQVATVLLCGILLLKPKPQRE